MAELEQFCILAKAQKGRACAALIEQVLSNRKIFVFGELLALPSVTALDESEHMKSLRTLELFAYGRWGDYRDSASSSTHQYIMLNEIQTMKLKQLTIVALAEQNKIIEYSTLLKELDIDSVRVLEDLIIETIYAGLISGKIDQKGGIFRVKSIIGRDPRPDKLTDIIQKMTAWQGRCKSLITTLEKSSSVIRDERDSGKMQQERIQRTANEIKACMLESVANGDRNEDDDYPQRGSSSSLLFGSGAASRSAKRTRAVTGPSGVGFSSLSSSSSSSSFRNPERHGEV